MDLSPSKSNKVTKDVHRTSASYDVESSQARSRATSENGVSDELLLKPGLGSKKKKGAKNFEIVFIVVFQLVTSISMTLINKAAVRALPYPVTLLLFQTLGTVVILEGGRLSSCFTTRGSSGKRAGRNSSASRSPS